MTAEREKAINEWLGIHCPKCANNDDRGTDFLNCQAECEVQKDIGIACIHYEEACDIEPQECSHKPCINYEDGCEEWAGCPCVHYKAESEAK